MRVTKNEGNDEKPKKQKAAEHCRSPQRRRRCEILHPTVLECGGAPPLSHITWST